MSEPFARIRAFEREVQRRTSTDVETFAFGTAFVNIDVPKRYDSNLLWVHGDGRMPSPDDLATEADRILGAAGVEHREVVVDDDRLGRGIAPRLLELGWSADHLVTMVAEREPDHRPATIARECDYAAARPLIEEVLRRAPFGSDEATVRQLRDFRAVLEHRVGARFHVADADGRPAAICERYVLDGVAQVEDVNTLEEHRGRGLGSAVVLAAVAAARGRGCDLVFLNADAEDWPRHLYARLGFVEVGRAWSFLKVPTT